MGRLKKIEDVGENSGYLEETANAWNRCCDFYIHLYKRSFESLWLGNKSMSFKNVPNSTIVK